MNKRFWKIFLSPSVPRFKLILIFLPPSRKKIQNHSFFCTPKYPSFKDNFSSILINRLCSNNFQIRSALICKEIDSLLGHLTSLFFLSFSEENIMLEVPWSTFCHKNPKWSFLLLCCTEKFHHCSRAAQS